MMYLDDDEKLSLNIEPTLPLINIVFLLLIFFMYAGDISSQDDEFDVELPKLLSRGERPTIDANTWRIAVAIDKSGTMTLFDFSYQLSDAKNVSQLLLNRWAANNDKSYEVARQLQIHADSSLPFDMLRAWLLALHSSLPNDLFTNVEWMLMSDAVNER